ncbi:MAG: hypothetical protein OXR73_07070, partial [Myxococcales bacterium]|nr:hypothetical protein [Myxococcales bacterium]
LLVGCGSRNQVDALEDAGMPAADASSPDRSTRFASSPDGSSRCGEYFLPDRGPSPSQVAMEITTRFFRVAMRSCELEGLFDDPDLSPRTWNAQLLAFTLWLLGCEGPPSPPLPTETFAPAFPVLDRRLSTRDVEAMIDVHMGSMLKHIPLSDEDAEAIRSQMASSASMLRLEASEPLLDRCPQAP